MQKLVVKQGRKPEQHKTQIKQRHWWFPSLATLAGQAAILHQIDPLPNSYSSPKKKTKIITPEGLINHQEKYHITLTDTFTEIDTFTEDISLYPIPRNHTHAFDLLYQLHHHIDGKTIR